MASNAGSAVAAPFLDTNVLLYLLSDDAAKADRCEALLAEGATVGVQVLNEFASVARRKLVMEWVEIEDVLGLIRTRCEVKDLTATVHDRALKLAARHLLSWYDALIVAAAAEAGSRLLYSEDMQHGLKIGGALTIRNPFLSA
ncbi:MAG: PIN domain-containing protein [Caldimonas sp.]